MVHIYQGTETTHRITNGVCAIQRSNVEHARGGQLWSPLRQFPAQDFKGKPNKKTLFRKISERKLKLSYKSVKGKKMEKGTLKTHRTQRLFKYGFSVDFLFCFELNQNSCTLLKHRDLLACVVAYNSWDTTRFWKPAITPPSHYNVRTCATVWPC